MKKKQKQETKATEKKSTETYKTVQMVILTNVQMSYVFNVNQTIMARKIKKQFSNYFNDSK